MIHIKEMTILVAVPLLIVVVLWWLNTKRIVKKQLPTDKQKGCSDKLEPLYITPEQVATYDDRPWRPFRWPYHQTMSIFKMHPNHWLDMDKYYVHYINEKKRVYQEYKDLHFTWLPGSEEACLELMEMVKDHMLRRYPLLFTTKDNGVHVKNELTGEILDFSEPLQDHPLLYLSRMAKEDFYVVQKNPKDELIYLTAAAVPFPGGGFGIKPIMGKSIDAIHTTVPYYKEKLQKSLERWLNKIQPDELTERASWHITWDHKLRSNDIYELKRGDTIDTEIPPDTFNVRIERQSFRRLPKSGAVVFANHPIFYSLDEMKDEPGIPSLIKKIIWEGPPDIIKSKHYDLVREHITEYLDSLIKRQLELGIIDENYKVKTLPTYPFAHFVTQKDDKYGWINPSAESPDTFNYLPTLREELKI